MEGIYHILKPCQESPEKFPQEIPLFFVYAFLYKKRILSREKHLKANRGSKRVRKNASSSYVCRVVSPGVEKQTRPKKKCQMWLSRSANRRKTRERTFSKNQLKMIKHGPNGHNTSVRHGGNGGHTLSMLSVDKTGD